MFPMLLSLLPLLSGTAALAAPVVSPVAGPHAMRVRATGMVDLQATHVIEKDCTGTQCAAWDQRTFSGLDLELALARGLAIHGDVGRLRDHISEADFDTRGLGWRLGLRGALPLTRTHQWWAAAQADLGGADPGDVGPTAPKSHLLDLSVGAQLCWGDPDGGFVGYLGGQAAPYWQQSVSPMGPDGLELVLQPKLPASAVAGFAFSSTPLGSSWKHSPRAVAHVEARAGQSMGAGVGLGLAW